MNENFSKYFLISRLGYVNSFSRLVNKLTKKINCLNFLWKFGFWVREQTVAAYELAYRKGYRTMLCDVIPTKDDVFVCSHEDDISHISKRKTFITKSTAAELLQNLVSNNLRRGGIMFLHDFLSFCKTKNCMVEIEIKTCLTEEQTKLLADLVKKYGFENKCIVHRNTGEKKFFGLISQLLPKAFLSRTANNTSALEEMISLDVPNPKLVTVTNYKGRYPVTLQEDCLKRAKDFDIGVIFSEVKNRRDFQLMLQIRPYLTFCASRLLIT